MEDHITTCIGSPNIAFIKYWGKRNEELILPTNSSLSMTLDESINTKTSVTLSKNLKGDSIFINMEEQKPESKSAYKLFSIMRYMKKLASTDKKISVISENNFPTSSGIASSASGSATLVYALSHALNLNLSQRELSIIARQISGSACRSIFGGLVMWERGILEDGSDSFAKQLFDNNYWSDLIDIIAIVSVDKKKISSRAGMKKTVETSPLYKTRPEIAEINLKTAIQAITNKNFDELAGVIMRDSNNMHATMRDTYPPIVYMNDISNQIVNAVNVLNDSLSEKICAYTFDAGPNAHIITTKSNENMVMNMLHEVKGIKTILHSGVGFGPRLIQK